MGCSDNKTVREHRHSWRFLMPAGMLLFNGLTGTVLYAASGKLSCFSGLCYGSLIVIGLGVLIYEGWSCQSRR